MARATRALCVPKVPDRALVSERLGWHHLSMKTQTAAASAISTLDSFQKGQVWKIGELNLAVTSVGKTLVHYKRYTVNRRQVQTTLSSKTDLRAYLLGGNAVLVAEAKLACRSAREMVNIASGQSAGRHDPLNEL